jgi:predicted nucleic acid-binding protein
VSKGYLLDTNVISRLSPGKPELPPDFVEWIRLHGQADELYISAMTIAEIQKGIRNLRRKGGETKSITLEKWLQGVVDQFQDRILPFDTQVAIIAGTMDDDAEASGKNPGLGDVIIAATAHAHDLTVITHNLRHFRMLSVSVEAPAGSS